MHELKQLEGLLPGLEILIGPGERLHAPILIHNATAQASEVTLTASLPPSWKELSGAARYPVAAHADYPLYFTIEAPANVPAGWYDIAFEAKADRVSVGTIKIRVNIGPGGLPQ